MFVGLEFRLENLTGNTIGAVMCPRVDGVADASDQGEVGVQGRLCLPGPELGHSLARGWHLLPLSTTTATYPY